MGEEVKERKFAFYDSRDIQLFFLLSLSYMPFSSRQQNEAKKRNNPNVHVRELLRIKMKSCVVQKYDSEFGGCRLCVCVCLRLCGCVCSRLLEAADPLPNSWGG